MDREYPCELVDDPVIPRIRDITHSVVTASRGPAPSTLCWSLHRAIPPEALVTKDLRASVIIDYQNVHLTGHGLFDSTRRLPRHETLIDPLAFAARLLPARNASQRPGYSAAVLRRVLVFRGIPANDHDSKAYSRALAQQAPRERDRCVQVTLRPLKYEYPRDSSGRIATDAAGKRMLAGPPREKGIDVLCALAAVREAQEEDVDLVILCSSDSDLVPAVDEARRLDTAKIETFCWWDSERKRGFRIHPTDRSQPIWCTRLDES